MVSPDRVDYFAYDGLCYDRVRENLLDREVPGRSAYVEGYLLGVVPESNHHTLIRGKATVVGEIFTLFTSELNLVQQFINRRRVQYPYDLASIEAMLPDEGDREAKAISTEARTLLIPATTKSIEALPPRGYAPPPLREVRGMCIAAGLFRKRYINLFLNTDYPGNTR